jgi:hypothetical protein
MVFGSTPSKFLAVSCISHRPAEHSQTYPTPSTGMADVLNNRPSYPLQYTHKSKEGRILATFRKQHRIRELGTKLAQSALWLLFDNLGLGSLHLSLALRFGTRAGHLLLLLCSKQLKSGLLFCPFVFLFRLCDPIRQL